jgi:hypothetical protein
MIIYRSNNVRKPLLLASTMAVVALATAGASKAPVDVVMQPSGILLLDTSAPDGVVVPEAAAVALSALMHASEVDPGNFAYPYFDDKTQSVVVAPVTPLGQQRAAALRTDALSAAHTKVAIDTRVTIHSRSEIDRAMDDLIGPQAEGVNVLASYPDPVHNRLILEVSVLDDAFLARAARTYGSDLLAIREVRDPSSENGPAVGRELDASPFYGGANVNGCTSGFAWHSGTTEMMLSAGHCWPSGGSASTPAMTMGTVTSAAEENYNSGTGTVYMTGESTYRGDISLIRIYSGKSSSARIYTGGAGSTSSIAVAGKWSRSPVQNDLYCTGGRVSGNLCNWKVVWSAAGNWTYTDPNPDEVVRRV